MMDLPRTTRVARRTVENDFDVTLHFAGDFTFIPGQFVMVWLPGVNEKPFSIAGRDTDGVFITVRRRGLFSSLLADVAEGDWIGIRGPMGNGFRVTGRPLMVAGGVGMAAVAPIAAAFSNAPLLYGENDDRHRMYLKRYPQARFFSLNGSGGEQGYPTDDLAAVIDRQGCDTVYCCGPEPMIVKTVRICESRDIPVQASVERYMKCGRGLCGQCAMGHERVCTDGPVFDGSSLLENPDFGRRQLTASGEWQYFHSESPVPSSR